MSKLLRKHDAPILSRRSFMVGSAGAGLMMGFGGLLAVGSARKAFAARKFSPAIWFEMDHTGVTRINIAKAEMGQHVGTALARIVAEELGVAWDDVSIKHVDSDPKWGFMVTGGSWSVFTSFKALSQAGAAGRTVLCAEGAKLLGADPKNCEVKDSKVSSGGKSVSFAEIVQNGDIDKVFTTEELEALPVKPATARNLIGKDIQAMDIPEKSTGTARYGIDAELDGMVYARPVLPPTRYGCSVQSVDDSAAKNIAGYLGHHVLNDPSETLQGWVTVTATSQWAAIQAADALKVSWNKGPMAATSEADILAEGERLVNDPGAGGIFVKEGDVAQARADASQTLDATYHTATALHFQLEPVNAIAEFNDGIWHLHTGNQWQSLILPVLAKVLEVPEEQIILHQYYLGGGFGRRLWGDYIIPAALTSKATGKPVKMVFTRPDDARLDCARSASVQRLSASLDAQGKLQGLEHAAAAGWPTLSLAPGFMGDGIDDSGKFDGFSINGADNWYTIPNHKVRAINNPVAQQTFLPGWLRSVGPGWVNWAQESFIDEVAHAAKRDPVEFRLAMLDGTGKNAGSAPNSVGGAKRLANVLRKVKAQSGWGKAMPDNEGMGVAVTFGQERNMPTWIGCVAAVRVDPGTGKVTVNDLYLSVDCGTVVHPNGALAQMESASLWGVSLALHEGTRIENGQVADTNLNTYTPLRMADVPNLHIEFVENDEFPVGLGEPATTVVGPAIGNAIFAATGVRMRDLPIRPEALKKALST